MLRKLLSFTLVILTCVVTGAKSSNCADMVCYNGGSCFSDQYGQGVCVCTSTFTGANCQTGMNYLFWLWIMFNSF